MGKKILVVDGDGDLRGGFTDRLRRDGYSTVEAEDGREGARLAREERPDLIVTGFWLPRLDGLGMADELQAQVETSEIPILCLAEETLEPETFDQARVFFEELIVKPVSPEDLARRIRDRVGDAGS